MTIKVLHTADWHIGSFPGPEVNGENARLKDIEECLEKLAATANDEEPDIIIISGDVFHQARVWSDRGLREARIAIGYIKRLAAVAPVCVLRGTPNHDSEEQFNMLRTYFTGDERVTIMDEPGVYAVKTYGGGTAVQVAALPGFDRGYYRARHPGLSKEEENEMFTAELAKMIIGLKAQCSDAVPSILSTHFTVTGANTESGQTQLFAQYEPVIEPATLAAADFDLVCLGHIHRPQQLEGCLNTFYCGSIFGLNFNDEGQQRGFYIHELEYGRVSSRFIETPSREFLTIRMDEQDISAFNGGGAEAIYSNLTPGQLIQNKIVRVLYNCTDESNKTLNKTLLESVIYNAGAYWVQEITPEKISVTANRNALGADNTPEDNLREYLEETGVDPAKAAEYIELARPIIAEALESTLTEKKTGLFMPVEIEVKNYRNYREERFSYDGIRFCTVNGENGAGKSSLFMDAMLDALFEEPREGDLTGWICNDPEARSGSIKFTFRLGEQLYRVTRTRAKSGKATLNLAELVDGEWTDRSRERYRDTQAEIENTIGMDSLTLKACALIMQDQYGLFLQADKEARMNILGNILGLAIYGIMEDKASDAATRTNRELRKVNDTLEEVGRGLPDAGQLERDAEQAQADIEQLNREIDGKTVEADNIRLKLNQTQQAAERAAKISSAIENTRQRKTAAEGSLAAQNAAASSAEALLGQEPEIKRHIERYNSLLEQERGLLTAKGQHDAKIAECDRVENELHAAKCELIDIDGEALNLKERRASYEKAVSEEPALTEKKAEYDTISAEILNMEASAAEYISATEAVNVAERALSGLKARTEAERRSKALAIQQLKSKATLLDDSGCPLGAEATCKFLVDAIAARDAIPTEEAALEAWDAEQAQALAEAEKRLNSAVEARDGISYSPDDLMAKRAVLSSLKGIVDKLSSMTLYKERIKNVDERLAELKSRRSATEEKIGQLEQRYEALISETQQTADAANRHATIAADLAAEKPWLEKEKLLPAALERKVAAQNRALELLQEIDRYEEELKTAEAERAAEIEAATGADGYKTQLAAVEAEINALRGRLQELNQSIGAITRQLEEHKKSADRMNELRQQAEKLSETAVGYEELKRAFSQDGIPHNIIRTIIPVFEATATNILGQMSGGRMSVELVTEKVLKSNNKKEVTALDIIINDAGTGPLPYMSRSGGERVKAALSVILALSEIKSTKAGVQLGFLFIDEPPFLDGPGVQAYCDALEAIQARYAGLKVMAITHDPSMKARFPQSVDVVKTAEGSKIIYD
ncbi:exonuclease subunit SbcD [Clostridium sp. D33t1_170424_F3]|uniref:exonuclease subunit SbcD n=1 Tax=Clostridium sp. D33t1_170424_F3 TaxID=2787099 RepID=UPI0018A9C504|nr:exonuclease subunit SbcD [Clostridium sp. D33t1_170424_F3]